MVNEVLEEALQTSQKTTHSDNQIFDYVRSNQKKELDISAINGGNITDIPSATFNINIKS